MEGKASEQLELNINGIMLIIFSLVIGAKIGIAHVANIFVAIVIGTISGIVIAIGIISFTGIVIFFGFQLANLSLNRDRGGRIIKPPNSYSNKLVYFLYSPKNRKEVFEPIIADWLEEHSEALSKNEIWRTRWINVRYTYAFLAAIWLKSPAGDLIEFFRKIAKS